MPDDQITQMAADPDFAKMATSEQRKALSAHDSSFGQMGDADISSFVSAHQAKPSQPVGTGLLGGPNATMQAPKTGFMPWLQRQKVNLEDAGTNALPGLGATAVGTLGARGGSIAGPVGTILGGIGGAGIGGMGGEAAKQMLRRWFGFEGSPQTSNEAAKQIMIQGGTQGAIQGVAEGLPALAGPIKNAAVTQYERALAPTTRINKGISQDIAPELIKRGEAGSLQGLENKASQQISKLGPQLNTAYQQAPASLPGAGSKVIQDLETLKQTYMPGGNIAQPQAVSAIEGVQNIVKQYGPDISPTNLRRLRQIFEEVPAERGAYAGVDLPTNYTLKAQQAGADSIRGILNKNPDIGAINKEISFWLDVQRVTSQSALRQTGQAGGLLKVLSPLAAGAAAATTGMKFGATQGLEAGAATALTTVAYQAIRSPAWRTASAVLKDRFANALARGSVGEATALAARFGVAAAGGPSQQSQQAPTGPPFLPQGQQP